MFFQDPVDYANIIKSTYEICQNLNDSSIAELTNQYNSSLSSEKKELFTHYADVEYLACVMKNQKLFTLQDLKVLVDLIVKCSDLMDSNSTIVKDSDEWLLGRNTCILKGFKSIKSDNSIDKEVLKKYLAVY
ncbi:uncharacterized protein LOC123263237 [Cotesia glomerata]|uniref:uncharacterized protein LOC123263237 n=1 Tax=Cotesia glomerata TaxID=32391 RepID=UPI001D027294|nr:uncharacterized protein LOC123263237 [Cotesia glomerata]